MDIAEIYCLVLLTYTCCFAPSNYGEILGPNGSLSSPTSINLSVHQALYTDLTLAWVITLHISVLSFGVEEFRCPLHAGKAWHGSVLRASDE